MAAFIFPCELLSKQERRWSEFPANCYGMQLWNAIFLIWRSIFEKMSFVSVQSSFYPIWKLVVLAYHYYGSWYYTRKNPCFLCRNSRIWCFFRILVHDLCFKLQNSFCFPRQCVSDCIATVSFNTAQLGCPACNISTKYQKNSN